MSRPAGKRGALRRGLSLMLGHLWLQGVAISTLTVALAIVGAYLTIGLNLGRVVTHLTTGSLLKVVVQEEASVDTGRALARTIAGLPQVQRAQYVSKEMGLRRLREQLGRHRDLLGGLVQNPLPAVVEIYLRPGPVDSRELASRLERMPSVARVLTGRPWLGRLEQAVSVGGRLGAALGGLLFLGVVLLVSNITRLAVYARQDELEVLALVGASPAYARWPFIVEAVVQALIAAGLASLLLWGLFSVLTSPLTLPLGLRLADLFRLPLAVPAALLGLGVLAGILGGLLGVGRILRREGVA